MVVGGGLVHGQFGTEDQEEGRAAFVEKRKPKFKHKGTTLTLALSRKREREHSWGCPPVSWGVFTCGECRLDSSIARSSYLPSPPACRGRGRGEGVACGSSHVRYAKIRLTLKGNFCTACG